MVFPRVCVRAEPPGKLPKKSPRKPGLHPALLSRGCFEKRRTTAELGWPLVASELNAEVMANPPPPLLES